LESPGRLPAGSNPPGIFLFGLSPGCHTRRFFLMKTGVSRPPVPMNCPRLQPGAMSKKSTGFSQKKKAKALAQLKKIRLKPNHQCSSTPG